MPSKRGFIGFVGMTFIKKTPPDGRVVTVNDAEVAATGERLPRRGIVIMSDAFILKAFSLHGAHGHRAQANKNIILSKSLYFLVQIIFVTSCHLII